MLFDVATPDPLACAAVLMLAFVLAGVIQTAWLKSAMSRRFQTPLDGGHTFRGQRLFGDTKTFRGFVVMVPAVGIVFLMLGASREYLPRVLNSGLWELSPTLLGSLGCWVGFWFMAGELPNSFIKRQLGVQPGDAPRRGWACYVCFVCDQIDSIVVALVALAIVVPTSVLTCVCVVILGTGVHWLFNVLLFLIGVKARPA